MKVKLTELPKELEIHVAEEPMTWQEAVDYAKSIGMRLPTKLELQAIAESTDAFYDLGWAWSSSVSSNPDYAWYVNLGNGNRYYDNKNSTYAVLCVSP